MSNESTRTKFLAGDFISENAVRGVFGQGRRTLATASTETVTDALANAPIAGQDTSPPPSGARPLRRWTVAELIARAVAAPPATGARQS
jgi:hypothetical protein